MTAIRIVSGPRAIDEGSEALVGALIGGCLVGDETREHCRFEIAAPRHFLYPALLLLLSEEPRHGYRLVDSLLRMGFGPVDRPGIYRALSDLEADGLLRSWEASSTAGSPRQVYDVTEAGAQKLRAWMDVIAAERAALDAVLKRFDNLPGDDGSGFDDG